VGGGDAAGVLDRGWETAEAADDGEQELRRSSGGASCSGRRKAVEIQVREYKSEFVESSGTRFKSRRKHSKPEQVLASSAACVAAQPTAARRGGARRGPAEAGKRRARCWSGTWRGQERRGGSWAREKWPARAAGSGAEKNRETRGWRLKVGTCLQISKNAGTPL
jgi:hypothetical protein